MSQTPRRLTVKLRGRAQAPNQSRGCTLSSSTRGDITDSHGPLQRLLEVASPPFLRDKPQCMHRVSDAWNRLLEMKKCCRHRGQALKKQRKTRTNRGIADR